MFKNRYFCAISNPLALVSQNCSFIAHILSNEHTDICDNSLMKTSVASLFSLISASFSRRNMRLVAEPTFVKIYEDWNESFDVSTILNFDVRKVFRWAHLPLGVAVHLLLLLQLDGGIEEVLNCHIIGTLLKSFGVVELVATWTRVIEFWMWERTGFNVDWGSNGLYASRDYKLESNLGLLLWSPFQKGI